jgi:hypothetical protein
VRKKREAQDQAAVQQQQAQAAAAAQAAQTRAQYNKSFATCLEGKGYAAR